MKYAAILLPFAASLAACGSNSGGGSAQGSQLKVVGSSTVYPFTTAVAEEFQRANPGRSAIVESTGTGSGMKLFCAGVGANTPDIANASRRIKEGELKDCHDNGVLNVAELPVGIDGLTIIQAAGAPALNLTQEDVYKALAANPYGQGPNTAQTWKDVNPSLPATRIRVLGPPPTSGTRDSLVELYMEKGCAANPQMEALKDSNPDQHKDVCTKIREDGAFVEAGENDNLIVQKVAQDPGTLGILGYSFLEENADKVKPVSVNGVQPTEQTISSLQYPGARLLYIYVKGEHLKAKPSLRNFVQTYAGMWGSDGALERRGLVPLSEAERQKAAQQASELKPLQASDLK